MSRAVLSRWIDAVLRRPLRGLVETPRRMLKGYVEPGMTVLDVGCGAGDHSLGMARLVGSNGRVVSVDTDAESLATLKGRAARAKLSGRIQARVCTEQDLEIHDLAGEVDFALAVCHTPCSGPRRPDEGRTRCIEAGGNTPGCGAQTSRLTY